METDELIRSRTRSSAPLWKRHLPLAVTLQATPTQKNPKTNALVKQLSGTGAVKNVCWTQTDAAKLSVSGRGVFLQLFDEG